MTVRISFLFLLLTGLVKPAIAQKTSAFESKDLAITWQLIANDFEHSGRCKSAFTFVNRSKIPFPAGGWSIFFNSSHDISNAQATGGLNIEHVNGDIFRIFPASAFKAI